MTITVECTSCSRKPHIGLGAESCFWYMFAIIPAESGPRLATKNITLVSPSACKYEVGKQYTLEIR